MNHFDQVANEWDSDSKVKMMSLLAEKTQEQLGLDAKLDILDFGCGTGLFGLQFLKYSKSLTGLDTSPEMLKVFSQKTKDTDGVKSIELDLEAEDVLRGQYDLILSSMAFHHLDDPAKVLGKLTGALRSSGKIAILDLEAEDGSFHPDPQGMGVKHFGFSRDQVKTWAEKNHLNVKIETINTLEKEGKSYNQFLALFWKK